LAGTDAKRHLSNPPKEADINVDKFQADLTGIFDAKFKETPLRQGFSFMGTSVMGRKQKLL